MIIRDGGVCVEMEVTDSDEDFEIIEEAEKADVVDVEAGEAGAAGEAKEASMDVNISEGVLDFYSDFAYALFF